MHDNRRSPLVSTHERLGAVFTDFAGWQMPVRYTSDLEEHAAVRTRSGLFDLSHMGEIRISGPDAAEALDYALASRISAISIGRAKYSLLLAPEGGVIDDLIVYRVDETDYLVVANAANKDVDFRELTERAERFDCTVTDESDDTALIAVQGPTSADVVTRALAAAHSQIAPQDIAQLKYYRCLIGSFHDAPLLVARTGYTGEDGFELYVPADRAEALWELLTKAGGEDLVPCGLACRDTLRLEAGMPLYGHELSRSTLPVQAGLGPVVALTSKGDFVGRSAVENTDASSRPVLVGMTAEGRRAGRAGYPVLNADGQRIGEITSGVLSPTLGYPIAMAFIDPAYREPDTEVQIDVRGKALPARIVALPFYKRA
ncbi:glycine cleavage system aminomethyltransferase GcvT [Devriesea agamarum]|uniref:glycine cleavage system aminomethyltransferase GcvT n=1 Tax=Devriesea agamarum TaxID=472569 RepID=UPI00071C4715|nr:glycine cleavage system aminomethyltransferase GcvT [Devriesea agamarum]